MLKSLVQIRLEANINYVNNYEIKIINIMQILLRIYVHSKGILKTCENTYGKVYIYTDMNKYFACVGIRIFFKYIAVVQIHNCTQTRN